MSGMMTRGGVSGYRATDQNALYAILARKNFRQRARARLSALLAQQTSRAREHQGGTGRPEVGILRATVPTVPHPSAVSQPARPRSLPATAGASSGSGSLEKRQRGGARWYRASPHPPHPPPP